MKAKPIAVAIEHRKGFFLAIDGDLNKREFMISGKQTKGLKTLKQYYQKVLNTCPDDYQWIEHEEGMRTPIDLTDKYYIELDELWDPNRNRIDKYTGEILYTPEDIIEEYGNVKEGITNLTEEIQHTKKLIDIMKTSQEQKEKRREAAYKGWETKRAKIQEQLEIMKKEQWEEKELAKIEQCKTAEEKPKPKKRLVEIACEIADQTAKQLEQNKQVKDEAPAQKASQTNNNPVNSNQMKTENQNASASNGANNNVQPAKSFGRKAKYAVAKSTEVGVVLATDLVIGGLVLTSDVIFALAEGVAWGQAVAIKPLGLHPDATRRELMEQAMARGENRSKFITALPKAAVALPIRAYNVAKQASKMRNDQTVYDINNAEIVE